MTRTKAERKRERFARQFHSDAFVEWTKAQPCVACGQGPCDPAHNPTRRYGTWRDISPLCRPCHMEQHGLNSGVETFQERHGIRFSETNAAHTAKWEAHLCG